jgi:hypothetical protein
MKPTILIVLALLVGLAPQQTSVAAEETGVAYAGLAVSILEPTVREGESVPLRGAGIEVVDLDPEGPAAMGGVRRNDVLLRLDDQRLFTPAQFRALLHTLSPGHVHRLQILREGTTDELDLRLGELKPNPEASGELQVVTVPFELWNSDPDWAEGLEDLIQQEPRAADQQAAAETPRWLAMLLGAEAKTWSNNIAVIILLKRETTELAAPEVLPDLSLPQSSAGATGEVGDFAIADDQGSVEVRQRGGRDFIIVRDAQGAVAYEGPMESSDDLLLLRPARPSLRQVVEDSFGPGRATASTVEIEVQQLKLPPRIF